MLVNGYESFRVTQTSVFAQQFSNLTGENLKRIQDYKCVKSTHETL